MITTTYEKLIADLKAQHAAATMRREAAIQAVRGIALTAQRAGRGNLSADEDARVDAAQRQRESADVEITDVGARLMEVLRAKAEDDATDALLAQVRSDPRAPAYDRVARVGQESRTYRPDEDPKGTGFIRDVMGAFRGDYSAGQRLGRHIDEERVERGDGGYMKRAAGDAGTGAFTGLVVPQYLTELYAPKARTRRPFADNCTHHDLPAEGMTVNISQMTTGSSVALQASEFATVSGTSMDDTLLTENIQTAAGFQDVSRQALERGTNIEEVTIADLFGAHASELDRLLLNQATTGLAPVSTGQSYVNATVDTTAIPAVWKQCIAAQNTAEGVLLAQAPVSHIIMHNRRWNWLCAAISASWPVIAGTNVPPTSWGMQLTNEYGPSVRGITASGLKIIVDANVSTACLAQATTGGTQDHIYVVAGDECHLWEDPNAPMLIRAEQPRAKDLAVTLVAYSFFAYCFRRYAGGSVTIHGTGLATPSFV